MKVSSKISSILIAIGVSSCISEQIEPQVDCSLDPVEVSLIEVTNSECGGTGSFTVEASGGESPYTYSIDGEANADGVFNVSAGNYTVTATSVNGCSIQEIVTVSNEDGGVNITSVIKSDAACGTNQGSIEVTASGDNEPFTYSINGGDTQESNIFSGLSNGTYNVIVADDNGCEVEQTVEVLSGVSFQDDIKSIIDTNCAISGCHVAGTGRSDLSIKGNVIAQASSIKSRTASGSMPRNASKLPQEQLDLIACWVDDGAQDN